MKRLLTITLILTMVLALAVPAAAFAKRGGTPANGKGKGNAPAVAPASDPVVEEAAPVKDKGKDKDKAKNAVEATEEEAVEDEDAVEGDELEADDPAEEPVKLTGIENALSRLQRNLERKQAKFEAGEAKGLPKGLQSTIAKFMSWLGIEPVDEATEGEDSSETSPTVEPEPIEDPDAPETDAPAETL